MSYRVEPLATEHDLAGFSSGNDDLDRWLIRHAGTARGHGTRTYVLVPADSEQVVGYFAVAPHLIEREEVPTRIGRGAPRQIPAILLAKVALRRDLQGRGLGSELLVRAIEVIVEAARSAGGKLIVVDAVDADAVGFYEAHDFQSLPGNERRLVIKLSTAAGAVGLPWP